MNKSPDSVAKKAKRLNVVSFKLDSADEEIQVSFIQKLLALENTCYVISGVSTKHFQMQHEGLKIVEAISGLAAQPFHLYLTDSHKEAFIENGVLVLKESMHKEPEDEGSPSVFSNRKNPKKLEALEFELLEDALSLDADLKLILDKFLLGLETEFPGMRATIMRVENGKLYNLSSPSMPMCLMQTIEGKPIGPSVGSCGSAAFFKKRVIVSDISTDPLWDKIKDLGPKYGFAACWSQPIFNRKKEVIATFANYYDSIKPPTETELELFRRVAPILSMVLENHQKNAELRASNERNFFVNKATNDAIYDWDILEDAFYWGDGFERLFGHKIKEGTFRQKDWAGLKHPEDKQNFDPEWDSFLKDGEAKRWNKIFRFRKADGTYAYVEEKGYAIRDERGKPVRMIGVLSDVSSKHIAEIRKALLAEIGQKFNNEEELKSTLKHILQHLVGFGNFAMAEAWLLSEDKRRLNLVSNYSPGKSAKMFYAKTKEVNSFEIGVGLPGTVWKKKQTTLWNKIDQRKGFVRKLAAKTAGLTAAMGLPLLYHNEVIGVLVFATENGISQLAEHSELFNELQLFLGTELKRKLAEEQLTRIFNAAPDIVCVAGFDGFFKKVNPAMSELLGYSEKELLNTPILEFTHPEDQEKTQAEFLALAKGEGQGKFENRYLTKDERIVWLSWTTKIFSEEGITYSIAKDITEQKELEILLESANTLARIGGWEIDPVKNTVYWSKITRQIHEVEENFQPLLEDAINFYREDVRKELKEKIDKAIEKGESWDFELPLITAKGNERWVRGIGQPEFRNGKCVRIYGSFQDIHQRKLAEIRLQNTANNIPGVIFQYLLRPDGSDKIMHVTKGSNEIWQYTPEECMEDVSRVWNQTQAGGDFEKVQETVLHSAATLERWHCQYRIRRPDGSLIWLEGFGTPRKLADGSVLWDSLVIDITEKKELEILLERATELARIGSWELDLEKENPVGYYSPMTRKIMELEDDFEPTLENALMMYDEEVSRPKLREAAEALINEGKPYDLELLIHTGTGNKKWVRSIGNALMDNGKCKKIFGSFQDIHTRKMTEINLGKKTQYLSALANVISNFLLSDDWNTTLNKSFEITGKAIGVDRVYFFEAHKNQQDELLYSQRFEWNSGTAEPQIDNPELQNLPAYSVPDFTQKVKDGKSFKATISEIEQGPGRTLMESQNIKSILVLPIMIEKQFHGFIGFDDCAQERQWSEDEESFLRTMTSNLAVSFVRKKNQEELKAAYREKEQILERITEAFFAVDKNWNVTYWNREAEQILGIKRDSLLGKNLWEKFPEARNLEFFKAYEKAMKTQTPVHFEEYYPEFGQWFEAHGYPSKEGISVFFRDITQKKIAEEEIKESNERFQIVSETTQDAIWDWDLQKQTLYWGEGFKSLFGHEPGDFEKVDKWENYLHPKDREKTLETLYSSIENKHGNYFEAEYRFLRADAKYAYVIDRGTVIRDAQGKAVRMVGAITDITHRKEYEASLRKINATLAKQAKELGASNAELEQFAYVASHDLQEPLRMVTSFLSQLEKKYKDQLDDKAKTYINFAVDGARRMRLIILDLLEFSRVGKLEESKQTVDVNELIEEIKALYRSQIEETRASIKSNELPVLSVQRGPVRQVFQNLVANALKYKHPERNPEIEISCKFKDKEWEFCIKDNGLGVSSDYYDKIFIIFQRLHGAADIPGTGMGLAITKKIVENMGGKIWLESVEGKGSSFYFTLPK